MSQIVLNNLGKSYGNVSIIKGISLSIHEGEFIVLVGPSGCGKSTLLRMIAGLEDITSGELLMHGEVVNTLPAKKRDIAMVFQSYALYPHMKVRDNMSFALKLASVSKAERMARVEEAAEILGLTHLLDRLPRDLSGGQRQRVAMGRALVRDPKAFLFDEPLSNLDAKLRHKMRGEIRKIHQRMGRTTIYVTHDQTEAMTMADRIVVLNAGHIEQVGTPEELYRNPDNLFVAGFIGTPEINTLKGVIQHGEIVLNNGYRFPCPLRSHIEGMEIICATRPHYIRLGESGMPAEIVLIEMTGEGQEIRVRINDQELIVVSHEKLDINVGQKVFLTVDAEKMFLFVAQTGKRLRS
ncbi:sn-glycerol-3-phosphate ABC transporter ATP-binding protein UgpC [Enterobacter hormaechei]